MSKLFSLSLHCSVEIKPDDAHHANSLFHLVIDEKQMLSAGNKKLLIDAVCDELSSELRRFFDEQNSEREKIYLSISKAQA